MEEQSHPMEENQSLLLQVVREHYFRQIQWNSKEITAILS
jgi:hypothetical protein